LAILISTLIRAQHNSFDEQHNKLGEGWQGEKNLLEMENGCPFLKGSEKNASEV
jgi:hypothetical protein